MQRQEPSTTDGDDDAVRRCPECDYEERTAVPFSVSGRVTWTDPESGVTQPTLTALNPRHFVDERGYTICPACGLVLDEHSFEATSRLPRIDNAYQPNHYRTLLHDAIGDLPKRYHRKPQRVADRRTTEAVTFLSGVLADAEALCSFMDVNRAVRDETLAALRAYYTTGDRRGARYEAVSCLVFAHVCTLLNVGFDAGKLWGAYSLSRNQRKRAHQRVTPWFNEHWRKLP